MTLKVGQMVAPKSLCTQEIEHLIFMKDIGEFNWWIGASDLAVETNWFWQKSQQHVEMFVWPMGGPTVSVGSDCMALSYEKGYKGLDFNCTTPLHPICQLSLTSLGTRE